MKIGDRVCCAESAYGHETRGNVVHIGPSRVIVRCDDGIQRWYWPDEVLDECPIPERVAAEERELAAA